MTSGELLSAYINGGTSLIGLRIKTLRPDRNDVDGVGEVEIPVGHIGTVERMINEANPARNQPEEYAVTWDDIDGKCAGWTIWTVGEIIDQAEIVPAGPYDGLLSKAQDAQTAYWEAVGRLEEAMGIEIEDGIDLSDHNAESLLERYGDEEEDDDAEEE